MGQHSGSGCGSPRAESHGRLHSQRFEEHRSGDEREKMSCEEQNEVRKKGQETQEVESARQERGKQGETRQVMAGGRARKRLEAIMAGRKRARSRLQSKNQSDFTSTLLYPSPSRAPRHFCSAMSSISSSALCSGAGGYKRRRSCPMLSKCDCRLAASRDAWCEARADRPVPADPQA